MNERDAGFGAARKARTRTDPPKMRVGKHATAVTLSGLRIHALRSGWVRVKVSHRELEGPACDARNAWFYRRNLRFDVDDGDFLPARMAEVGLEPSRVTHIVISHFHADHMGAIPSFPNAEILIGPGNWPSHTGSTTCPLGAEWEPTVVAYRPDPISVFPNTLPIAGDSRIRMVPLPGHTPGHAGVLVEDGTQRWLMAGDATFDENQTRRLTIAGVTQEVAQAEETQRQLCTAMNEGIMLLPAHDPTVFERMDDARR